MSKVKTYHVLAERLRSAHNFVSVDDLASQLGLEVRVVRNSISTARQALAVDGIMIINKLGSGYRIGTESEFLVEADKASKRALGHLTNMAKMVNRIRAKAPSPEVDGLASTIVQNLRGITILFDGPDRAEFNDHDDFVAALEAHGEEHKMVPDRVRDDPHQLIDE